MRFTARESSARGKPSVNVGKGAFAPFPFNYINLTLETCFLRPSSSDVHPRAKPTI